MSPRSVRSLPAPAPFTTVRASPDAPILSQSRLAIQHDLLVCKPRPAAWHGNPTHPSERTALGWGRCVFPGAGSGARAPNQAKPCVQSVGHDAPVPPQAGASVTSAIFSSARKSERNQLPVDSRRSQYSACEGQTDRPELAKAIRRLEAGDLLVVTEHGAAAGLG